MTAKPHGDAGAQITRGGIVLSWPLLCGLVGIPLGSVGVYHQYSAAPEATATEARLVADEARIAKIETVMQAVQAVGSDVSFLKAQAEFHTQTLARIADEQRDERAILISLSRGLRQYEPPTAANALTR